MERMFTVSETANHLRVSQTIIYRWVREGKLPAVRAGRVVRIPEGGLEIFLKRSKERSKKLEDARDNGVSH